MISYIIGIYFFTKTKNYYDGDLETEWANHLGVVCVIIYFVHVFDTFLLFFLIINSYIYPNNIENKWQGPALGACSGVRKNIRHKNKLKKNIKDSHNGTIIGTSNIFGGNQHRFQISAQ